MAMMRKTARTRTNALEFPSLPNWISIIFEWLKLKQWNKKHKRAQKKDNIVVSKFQDVELGMLST